MVDRKVRRELVGGRGSYCVQNNFSLSLGAIKAIYLVVDATSGASAVGSSSAQTKL